MAMAPRKVLTTDEAALVLRLRLGDQQSWVYTLADMRRNRTSLYGMKLLPVARVMVSDGYQPVYLTSQVFAFAQAVAERLPNVTKNKPVSQIEIDMDLEDGRSWHVRKFKVAARPARPAKAP